MPSSKQEVRVQKSVSQHANATFKKGSKSFSLASRLFDSERKEAASLLYSWCRYCDDQIDSAEDPALARARLEDLKRLTTSSVAGESQDDPVFIAFQQVTATHSIPEKYPVDLLKGMEMDATGASYETLDDLLLYCYRVAGTVGLMMSHIMGVSDPVALSHAVNLGNALQLINISRDVMDDARMGRVYIPKAWLRELDIPEHEIENPIHREKLAVAVTRLLDVADKLCRSGDDGLKYLSWRAAVAVFAARLIYAEIGVTVRQRAAHAWDERVVISGTRKIVLAFRAFLKVAASLPQRLRTPWLPVPINQTWSPS